jgi:hypothetical protein
VNFLTSNIGATSADLVTYTPSGTGAVARSAASKFGDTVSVKDFGAIGDGVADDTAEIQSALNAPAKHTVFPAAVSYKCGAISVSANVSNSVWNVGSLLSFYGSSAGFEFAGNIDGLLINNLNAVGDGVVGNLNRAIWTSGAHTIANIHCINPRVSNMVQGLDFGAMSNVTVDGGYIANSVGTASGQGYGIVAGNGADNITISGVTFYNNARHALYLGHTNNASVLGCHFNNHSNGVNTASGVVALSRGNGYSISGCNFNANYGPGIVVDDDSVVSGILTTTSIVGNTFVDHRFNSEIIVGMNDAPTANIGVACVNITGNSINRVAVNSSAGVILRSCRELTATSNAMYLPDSLYAFSHINDAGPTATAITKLVISNNVGSLTAGGKVLYLDTALCGGTAEIVVENNRFANNVVGRPIAYQTDPPTNPNIRHDGDYFRPVTLAAGSQTLNVAGYNNFVITGNASGSTITNFDNAYENKVITLRFQDAFTTINRTNAYLSGGVNFVSSQYDILKLQYIGSAWYEISRSVNL